MSNQTHIRFDWAVKKLLRSKANFGILEGFLCELLNENIKIQEIIESESNRETEDDKSNRVDIMVKDSKGELIIVEIQNTRELDYFYKVLYNTSKAIAENIAKGDPYWKVKKVITVSVVYFDLGQGLDYVYHGDTRFIGIHQKDVLELSEAQKRMFNKPSVTSIFPDHYIIKVNDFNDTARDSLDEWIYFFKNSEIKKEFKAKGLAEAREKLKEINLRGKELAAYKRYLEQLRYESSIADTIKFEERFAREKAHEEGLKQGIEQGIEKGIEKGIEQGIEKGINQGIEKGREQGEKNKALEIARKLKEKGVDIDMICETSGLSKEVVKSL
jgi:predicted transposase/invertase (TIGR01784 family)